MQQIYGFLLALPPLIIIHELGHLVVARWCGVKVLRFSIGFGRVLWSRRFGNSQIEWAISALPLGGYVSMLDKRTVEQPIGSADMAQEFTSQPVWKRMAIVAAGPVTNFLLAILLYAGLNMHGVPEISNQMRAPGADTAAAAAGFQRGDRIVEVNGMAVETWRGVRMALIEAAIDRTAVPVQVQRNGSTFGLEIPSASMRNVKLDGDVASDLGFVQYLPEPGLAAVMPGGPADKAGLKAGDVVIRAGGKRVVDSGDLVQSLQEHGARPLALEVARGATIFAATVVPVKDPAHGRVMMGVSLQPVERVVVRSGPVEAVSRAVVQTWDLSVLSLRLIGKMLVGEISWKNISGPITMGDYAGQSLQAGFTVFLGTVAFLSISLGVMNLLPIPVLDGGHLLYYLVEVLTGRPLPERIGEYAQRAGLGLLVMLMALAVFNDVVRLL